MTIRLPLVSLCLIACGTIPASAQSANNPQAYLQKDYPTCMSMMGAAMVNALGGKIVVLDQYRRTEQALQQHQLTLENMTVGEPNPVVSRSSDIQFSVIPEKYYFIGSDGKYILNSYLLAVSENNGQSWSLIEGSAQVAAYIKNYDLVLYGLLKLPVRKIYLVDDPQMYMLEKSGGFVTSPETFKHRKTLRKSNL